MPWAKKANRYSDYLFGLAFCATRRNPLELLWLSFGGMFLPPWLGGGWPPNAAAAVWAAPRALMVTCDPYTRSRAQAPEWSRGCSYPRAQPLLE